MDFVAGILSPFLIGFEPGGVLAFTHGCGIRKFEIRCNGYTKLRRVHVTQILFFFFFEKKHFGWEKGEFHIVLCFRTNSWIRVQEKKKNGRGVKKAVGIPKARKERLWEMNLGGMLGVTAHNMILLLYERGFFIRPLIRGLVL